MAEALAKKLTIDEIKTQYPVHFCVWNNDYDGLKEKLDTDLAQVSVA